MMVGFFMVASLILGLIAWILPIINLVWLERHKNKNWRVFSVLSIGACAGSLSFQIAYANHLVKARDWVALMDTIGVVAFASAVLLVVTIVLNIITWLVSRGSTTDWEL